MSKPRELGNVARQVMEAIETEAVEGERRLRQAVIENAGNVPAVKALMSVSEPLSNIARSASVALADVDKAHRVIGEAHTRRRRDNLKK